jgi:hypothetical protein
MRVPIDGRAEVLRIASGISTEPGNSDLVVANAKPLLAWVQQAATDEDQKARILALTRWNLNSLGDDADESVMDHPEEFLVGVMPLYGFLAAGEEGDEMTFEVDEAALRAFMDGDTNE